MRTEEFISAYIVCALWSSTTNDDDSGGAPLDDEHGPDDIAPETMENMRSDCLDFIEAQKTDLLEYCERMQCEQWTGAQRAGHDFWLTRNGHGAGFWDRGLGDLGERLSKAAKVYGSVDLYLGDDGKIYS